jgi:hypothetical protein
VGIFIFSSYCNKDILALHCVLIVLYLYFLEDFPQKTTIIGAAVTDDLESYLKSRAQLLESEESLRKGDIGDTYETLGKRVLNDL